MESLKQNGMVVGNHVRVKVVKNKVAPPFREAEFDIMFGKGISKEGDILDLAAKEDIIEKSGAWYAYQGQKIGQGRENAKEYLRRNPAVMWEIEQKVRAFYNLPHEETMPEEYLRRRKRANRRGNAPGSVGYDSLAPQGGSAPAAGRIQ